MFRIAVFISILFVAAAGFAWLSDNPGTVTIVWPWAQNRVEISLLQAGLAIAVIAVTIMMIWWVISGILKSPKAFGRWRAGRRRDKGYAALSRGLIAANAGNAPLAKKLARDSDKLLENEPLVALLDAQTALLEDDHGEARKKFETMLGNDDTRLLGLRGLYLEAEKEGELQAAAHFADEANRLTPNTPWAAQAVLKINTATNRWESALQSLENIRSAGLLEKSEHARKKAVILTALALEEEDSAPEKAKAHALAAHKLAPDLVPASVTAARVAARLNDLRKAGKVLEVTWAKHPHPELADSYVNLRGGDTSAEKLKRAVKLMEKVPDNVEGSLAVAKAAVEAKDFDKARDFMDKVLRNRPSEQACLVMADIEEAEHGDRGRVKEWLSRAVSAPKDFAWIADGVAADEWAPCSPSSGELDAYEWTTPPAQLAGSASTVDYALLASEPLEQDKFDTDAQDSGTTKPITTPTVATGVAAGSTKEASIQHDIEDAEVVDDVGTKSQESKATSVPGDQETGGNVVSEPVASATRDANSSSEEMANGVDAKPAGDVDIEVAEQNSPYKNPNLDSDDDGLMDRRPDDPGIAGKKPEKKGWLF